MNRQTIVGRMFGGGHGNHGTFMITKYIAESHQPLLYERNFHPAKVKDCPNQLFVLLRFSDGRIKTLVVSDPLNSLKVFRIMPGNLEKDFLSFRNFANHPTDSTWNTSTEINVDAQDDVWANDIDEWKLAGRYKYTIKEVLLNWQPDGNSVTWIISKQPEGNIWIFSDFVFHNSYRNPLSCYLFQLTC
jgi:hypothetical protein